MARTYIVGFPYRFPKPFVEDENRLIDRLIEQRLVDVFYQPIVDLHSKTIFAYEALGRPNDGYFRTPEELIESAARGGRMGRLGRHLRALAIQGCPEWPIFLNLDPREFDGPYLIRPDDPIVLHGRQVYLEISETVPTEFSDECFGVLSELRQKGVLLTIDDFGAGSSSLRYIVELRPDIIKLDRELIMGCVPGSREFNLLRSVTELCHRMNAKVVAEGIETVAELESVIAAGVDYGQGFLLSLPNRPPPPFFWPPEIPDEIDDFVRNYVPTEEPADQQTEKPEATPKTDTEDTQERQVDTGAQATIRYLSEQIADLRQQLVESLEERSLLAEKLKRYSHLAQREADRSAAAAEAAAKPRVQVPVQQDEDTVEFLRQLEVRIADEKSGDD